MHTLPGMHCILQDKICTAHNLGAQPRGDSFRRLLHRQSVQFFPRLRRRFRFRLQRQKCVICLARIRGAVELEIGVAKVVISNRPLGRSGQNRDRLCVGHRRCATRDSELQSASNRHCSTRVVGSLGQAMQRSRAGFVDGYGLGSLPVAPRVQCRARAHQASERATAAGSLEKEMRRQESNAAARPGPDLYRGDAIDPHDRRPPDRGRPGIRVPMSCRKRIWIEASTMSAITM